MCLHHSRFAVAVDNESRQVVALTVNKTVSVVSRVVGNARQSSHFKRRRKPFAPKPLVNVNVFKRQHPDSDAPNLEMPYGDELIIGIKHPYRFALFDIVIGKSYGTREYPGMEAFEAFLFAPFKYDCFIHFAPLFLIVRQLSARCQALQQVCNISHASVFPARCRS